MPKKGSKWGEDTRGQKAKAQKAAAQASKDRERQAHVQAEIDAEWQKGSNRRAARKAEKASVKAEEKEFARSVKEAQLAAEEAELDAMKKHTSAKKKSSSSSKSSAPTRGIDAALAGLRGQEKVALRRAMLAQQNAVTHEARAAGAAAQWNTGIDSALDALSNKSAAQQVDRHPERRMKAAYRAFEEREMPRLKEEFPGLRRQQLKQRLFAIWKKSPENPMNQENAIAFNAKLSTDAHNAPSD